MGLQTHAMKDSRIRLAGARMAELGTQMGLDGGTVRACAKAGPSRLGRFALGLLVLLLALFAFGLDGHDEAAFRSFCEACDRWQINPEFRYVAFDYTVRGSAAMRTRPFCIATRRCILAVRSLPLLPKKYAVNPTSELHYQNFSRGPLCAYLHLCGEQDVANHLGLVEAIGRHESEPRKLLDSFQMDFPVAKDAGAVQSVSSLVQDTEASRPFAIRSNINLLLGPPIAQIAGDLGIPQTPEEMTPDQQQAVLDHLDAHLKRHDRELWRTKQVSDFCGGIWAQVFGPPYKALLAPIVMIHDVSRIALVVLLAFLALHWRRKCKRAANASGQSGPQTSTPQTRDDANS